MISARLFPGSPLSKLNKKKFNLLIVDDNKINLLLAKIKLEKIFPGWFEFTTAGNGDEAVEKVIKEKFDLILMDSCMPISGEEAIRQIRNLEKDLPILSEKYNYIITFSTEQTILGGKFQLKGSNDSACKPIQEKDIEQVIRNFCQYNRIEDRVSKTQIHYKSLIKLS